MTLTIGVDVGGTKVLAAVVDPHGTVVAETRRQTPAEDVSDTLDRIVDAIAELAGSHEVEAVGIGAAGWIDRQRSTVLFAPNLAWRHEPLRDHVAAKVNLPVVVENDANVAGWAEFRFGAAEHVDSSVMFTVGTGIGGALMLGGELVRGAHGIAAEFGHMLAVPDGQLCGCNRRGCLEQYASGNALVREAQRLAQLDPDRAAGLLALAGDDPERVDGPMVTRAAQAGDAAARAAFAEIGRWLGIGMANLVQVVDPEMIVVGGGVIEAGELLLGPTRDSCAAALAQRSILS
ncbi:MAG: ROK family protein, partial [Micromonosporaceae bacterium]|nr:ROK family protein [Micromonosporaceae bacterium]